MAVRIRRSQVMQSLNLTPLIDVVFLLLIFFLVASRFAEEERELNVKLPAASDARPMVLKPKDIELGIDATGNYFLGSGQPMTLEQAAAALVQAAASNPMTQSVVIRADSRCSWNHVAQAMNACYRAGLQDVKASLANQ